MKGPVEPSRKSTSINLAQLVSAWANWHKNLPHRKFIWFKLDFKYTCNRLEFPIQQQLVSASIVHSYNVEWFPSSVLTGFNLNFQPKYFQSSAKSLFHFGRISTQLTVISLDIQVRFNLFQFGFPTKASSVACKVAS